MQEEDNKSVNVSAELTTTLGPNPKKTTIDSASTQRIAATGPTTAAEIFVKNKDGDTSNATLICPEVKNRVV